MRDNHAGSVYYSCQAAVLMPSGGIENYWVWFPWSLLWKECRGDFTPLCNSVNLLVSVSALVYQHINRLLWLFTYFPFWYLGLAFIRSGVTLDLLTYVHPGRTCRFKYAVRWSDIPRKSRHGLVYFHFPALIGQGNAIRSSTWLE